MRTKEATATITAQNTGTTQCDVKGQLSVSITGTWAATVWLQRTFDESNYFDVKSYTANVQETLEDKVGASYRLFCKTGGFTSGSIVLRLIAE
jgi:hypothetical protein